MQERPSLNPCPMLIALLIASVALGAQLPHPEDLATKIAELSTQNPNFSRLGDHEKLSLAREALQSDENLASLQETFASLDARLDSLQSSMHETSALAEANLQSLRSVEGKAQDLLNQSESFAVRVNDMAQVERETLIFSLIVGTALAFIAYAVVSK